MLSDQACHVIKHPWEFTLQTLKSFNANNGLLLAGAIAYYALLSIVPLLILSLIALSHIVDQAELLQTIRRYLEWLVPSQSKAVIDELSIFLDNRVAIGSTLAITMLFFSSLAFSSLNQAMAVIFYHRFLQRKRHFLVSALLPYSVILVLGAGLLGLTVASNFIESLSDASIVIGRHQWNLAGISGVLLYLLGLSGEILMLTLIYWVMPVGRLLFRHALIGGATAALLWEIIRHILLWYFLHLSQASVVYGTLTTAIVAMLSLEIGATLLLLGAQVIAQYELIGKTAAPQRS